MIQPGLLPRYCLSIQNQQLAELKQLQVSQGLYQFHQSYLLPAVLHQTMVKYQVCPDSQGNRNSGCTRSGGTSGSTV